VEPPSPEAPPDPVTPPEAAPPPLPLAPPLLTVPPVAVAPPLAVAPLCPLLLELGGAATRASDHDGERIRNQPGRSGISYGEWAGQCGRGSPNNAGTTRHYTG
jgi:hypothetical protein